MAICFVAFLPLMVVRPLVLVTIPTVLALPRAARAGEGVPCAPFAQEDPPEPTLRTDRHALDRLVRINQAVKNIPHAVLFLGDSLTEGWDPEVWGQNLDPRGVLNAGISGDRTDHLLWRLANGNLDGPPARAVVLLIGTNDLSFGRSPELTADGIRANLIALRQRVPDASSLVLGLLPREEAPTVPLRLAVRRVNRLIGDSPITSISSTPKSAMYCSTATAG